MSFTPIPDELRDEMSKAKFYKHCIFTRNPYPEWHHHLHYRNKRINARFSILPISKGLHTESSQSVHKNPATRELCTYFCLLRATEDDLKPYNRRDWAQEFKYLDTKYRYSRPVVDFILWCKQCKEPLNINK